MSTQGDEDVQAHANSLSVTFPLLAAEWHPTMNGDLAPSSVTPGAKLKAFWLCPACGHVWQARVGSRAHGHGCPACARRETGRLKSLPGPGDSLAERYPEVAAEWHPTRNGGLTPDLVGYASNKKIWWLCARCGYEWEIQVANRTRGSSCRMCAHATLRTPRPGGSLVERNPEVAAEWHPTLNGDITPNDVAFSAKRKAWWKCTQCGNEWEAAVGNRATGAGCPPCSRRGGRGRGSALNTQREGEELSAWVNAKSLPASSPDVSDRATVLKVPPSTALPERHSEVAAQWHPTRNDDRTPADFRWASNERAWWLCPTCGHEWSAIIASRTRGGAGCPKCGRRRAGAALGVPKPGQSLAERLPELAAQWHPTRNGDFNPTSVTAKSGKRAWWLCPECGNEWEAQIGSRANGYGCKACATQKSAVAYSKPSPRQSLAEQDEELAGQWHPTRNGDLTPADVTGNSGKKAWWLCERGHEWQAMINNRTKARGCPKCILWGTSVEEIRLRHELVAAGVPIEVEHTVIYPLTGRPLNCDMVVPAWNVVIEFDGNRFHKTPEGMAKDLRKTAALREAGWTVIRVREDLEPIGEHDVVVPLFSTATVRTKAVLTKLDELGFKAARHDAYLATDGPWAAEAAEGEARCPRARSLAIESPTLAAEWDYVRNAPLTPEHVMIGSGEKAWWLCAVCGNSWRAVIGSRATGHGCPACGRAATSKSRSTPKPGHSLAERHPQLAAEWHPSRNGELTADAVPLASSKKVWWVCPNCGVDYEMMVSKRSGRGSRCPRRCRPG
jgi:rubrerythrin